MHASIDQVLRLVFAALAFHSFSAEATVPENWKDITYGHPGPTSTLGQALTEFAEAMKLRVQIPAELARQKSAGGEPATTPATYLDRLASRHYLAWFVYGGALHVGSAQQLSTRKIELRNGTVESAKQALIGIGLFEPKFGWGEVDDQPPTVLLNGPEAYVALVRSALEGSTPESKSKEPEFMVFQLKHASVADYQASVRDKVSVHPGVTSVLRTLMSDAEGTNLRGSGTLGSEVLEANRGPVLTPSNKTLTGPPSWATNSASWAKPTIEAFPATNSIIIRDRLDRKPMYEKLIASLDQPSQQVEVLATVVDAQAGTLREWSVDLSLGLRNGAQVGSPVPGEAALAQPNVVLWAANIINAKLKALETDGKANVVSRPSILTINNQGASLDLSKTAYLKLQGERVADVKTITVGSLLSVTPRVIAGDAKPSILLTVSIEDGAIDATVALPQALRNSINTQAIVGMDEALVIGGYQQARFEDNRSAVPGLSSIPLIGELFKGNYKEDSSRERLYIISARVIGTP